MANPDWFDVQPLDRQSEAMLKFVLESCQDIKQWAYSRLVTEGREPGPTPKEVRREQWLDEYLRLKPQVVDAPRHALRSSLETVLLYGKRKDPKRATAWNKFEVQPRQGWRKSKDKVVEWEEWTQAQPKRSSAPRVTKEKTRQELFEQGKVSFRWAKVVLGTNSLKRLAEYVVQKGLSQEEFVSKLKAVNFRFWRGKWQINFDVSR